MIQGHVGELWVYTTTMETLCRSVFSQEEDIQHAAEINPHFIYFLKEPV